MKILLIHPRSPDTFWSFRHALKFVSKKAGSPPLGLLTVAALLPALWEKRLVDMNVSELKDEDIRWADYVFLGAMSVQQQSARTVIRRCKSLGVKVVAGGPLFTAMYNDFADENVDHFVLGEAEVTLPRFLNDLAVGRPQALYTTREWADVRTTPVPLWELINLRHYATMSLQYSRGCPYDCEFCDITVLYGRTPRTKEKAQVIAELESLYLRGWRGNLFLVDDNFIGNKNKVKREILPAIIQWMEQRGYPFILSTEASINLADDEELAQLMVKAGFDTVFVGIETPHEESLLECGKVKNQNRDLIGSIKKIQRLGMQVQGGFIIGFDSDPVSIFERLSGFIQESGIATAMVGLLNAPRGTKLYQRLEREGRLLHAMSGDNTDVSMNFEPKMDRDILVNGYRSVMQNIYAPKPYYARVRRLLRNFKPTRPGGFHIQFSGISALGKSIVLLGVVGAERVQYWKLFFWSLLRHPRLFPDAITLAIYGFHFRKVSQSHRLDRQYSSVAEKQYRM
ncbi:MAG: B12-binding domain-containing radical SAM protein [Calditrichota bacterium]